MLSVLLALAATPGEWPVVPDPEMVRRGASIAAGPALPPFSGVTRPAEDPQRPLTAVFDEDRRSIGRWSNGQEKLSVEWVTWLSPGLMARWLGFLQAREHWSPGVLESRWQYLREELSGSLVFVVELAAYPKQPTFGVGDPVRANPEEIRDVRFVLTSGEEVRELVVLQERHLRSRSRFELESFPWWLDLPVGAALAGEFEREAAVPLPLGGWYRSWYVVALAHDDGVGEQFEVRVLSRRKERVAEFSVRG